MVKNVENCSKSLINLCGKLRISSIFFYVFHHFNLIFFLKITKVWNIESSYCTFFFDSGVFQNFDVDFWPLLKAEKGLTPKQFLREFFFVKILFSIIHMNL